MPPRPNEDVIYVQLLPPRKKNHHSFCNPIQIIGMSTSLLIVCTNAFATDTVEHEPAAELEFNESLLRQSGTAAIDLRRYSKGNPTIPGKYRVDLYVNQTWIGRAEITLAQSGPTPPTSSPLRPRAARAHRRGHIQTSGIRRPRSFGSGTHHMYSARGVGPGSGGYVRQRRAAAGHQRPASIDEPPFPRLRRSALLG